MEPICAPLLANLFLCSYENKFLDKLIKKGKIKFSRKFKLSYRHIDDLISLDNKIFDEFISDIYQCTIHTQPVLELSFLQLGFLHFSLRI